MSSRTVARGRSRTLSVRRGEDGQAAIELIGALPLVVGLGLALLQLLAVGYAGVMAGHAAEAAALAAAAGRDPAAAVRSALPGWPRSRAAVVRRDGRVRVTLRPPSPIPAVARALEIHAEAAWRP